MLTDDQAGYHLRYEIWMLHEAFHRLAQETTPKGRPPNERERIVINALFESYCIHARVLFEFFEDPGVKKGKGDKSSLYVDEKYEPFVSVLDQKKRLHDKLHQQIAHLDRDGRYFYSDPERIREIELSEMYDLLRDELANFKRHLRPEVRITLSNLAPRHAELSSPTMTTGPGEMLSTTVTFPRKADD